MKRLLYVIFTGCLMSLFFVSGLAPSPSIPIARAQGCSIIDTVTVIAQDTITTGSVATKAGRRYEYRVSGDVQEAGSTRHDLFHFTTNDWASSGADWLLVAGNYITGLRGTSSYPAYSGSHEYTIDAFGTGSPVQARIHYGTGTISIIIEVCEYPPDYAIPTCTIIDRMDIITNGATHVLSSVTLASGQPYTLFLVGQSSTNALPTTSWDHLVDPYWQTSDGWAAQSASSGFVNIGNTTSSTLIDTTYQSDHIYEVDVTGGGLQIDAIAGFGYGSRGGVEIYICDPSAPTPTPVPSATPTSSAPPAFARTCVLLGSANANFTSGNAWTYLVDGSVTTPSDAASGIQAPPTGLIAVLYLKLQQSSQYKVEVQYRFRDLSGGLTLQSFTVGLGLNQDHIFPIAISPAIQSAAFGPFNFVPDSDGLYPLKIVRPGLNVGESDPKFVVDWICVTQTSSAPDPDASGGGTLPGSGDGSESPSAQCTTCEYNPQGGLDHLGDDIGQIVNWLGCIIRGVWECVILAALSGIWFTIRNILGFLANIMIWVGHTARGAIEWLHSVNVAFWAWLGGSSRNATTIAGNSATAITNSLSGAASDTNGISQLFQWISGLFQSAANLITRVFGLGQRGLRIYNIFTDAINRGLDPSSPSSIMMASSISASDAIYYLRLGFYVMDNTIFAGPFWYWVGTSQFLVALMVGIWVINALKNLLKR